MKNKYPAVPPLGLSLPACHLLGFVHAGDNQIVEVLKRLDAYKVLSGDVEAEVLLYQHNHIYQIEAIELEGFASRARRPV